MEITFDKSVKKEVLNMLDKDVDKENFIVEKQNQEQRVLTFDGQEVSLDEFGGVKKGSELFIKDDIASLMRLFLLF